MPGYAFDGSTSNYRKTAANASGQAVFTLPIGGYRFQVDLNGTQFWSGSSNYCTLPGCTSSLVTTTAPLTVTVLDTASLPQVGLPAYTFNGITYTNFSKTMNSAGQAVFTLPMGSYRFRADTTEIGYAHLALAGHDRVGDLADVAFSLRQAMRLPMQLATAIRRFLDARSACVSPATSQWYARRLAALAPLHARKLRSLTRPELQAQWLGLTKKQSAGRSILAARP